MSETRLTKTSCFSDLLLFAICTSPKIHTVPHLPPLPRLPQKRVLENFPTCYGRCANVFPRALGFSPVCQIFFEVLQGGPPVLNSPSLFKTEYLKKKKKTIALQHFCLHIAILHFPMTDISVSRRTAKINRLSLKPWSHLL